MSIFIIGLQILTLYNFPDCTHLIDIVRAEIRKNYFSIINKNDAFTLAVLLNPREIV